jgi:hypothetical protein
MWAVIPLCDVCREQFDGRLVRLRPDLLEPHDAPDPFP